MELNVFERIIFDNVVNNIEIEHKNIIIPDQNLKIKIAEVIKSLPAYEKRLLSSESFEPNYDKNLILKGNRKILGNSLLEMNINPYQNDKENFNFVEGSIIQGAEAIHKGYLKAIETRIQSNNLAKTDSNYYLTLISNEDLSILKEHLDTRVDYIRGMNLGSVTHSSETHNTNADNLKSLDNIDLEIMKKYEKNYNSTKEQAYMDSQLKHLTIDLCSYVRKSSDISPYELEKKYMKLQTFALVNDFSNTHDNRLLLDEIKQVKNIKDINYISNKINSINGLFDIKKEPYERFETATINGAFPLSEEQLLISQIKDLESWSKTIDDLSEKELWKEFIQKSEVKSFGGIVHAGEFYSSLEDVKKKFNGKAEKKMTQVEEKKVNSITKDKKDTTPKKESVDYSSFDGTELSNEALKLIRNYSTDPKELSEYLEFMGNFHSFSARNIALIQKQWSGAKAVATFDQWKNKHNDLDLTEDDINSVTRTIKNKKTGKTEEIELNTLSVRAGEKSQITVLRPNLLRYINVADKDGSKQKFQWEWSPEEKKQIKEGKLKTNTALEFRNGKAKFSKYKVFDISQTNLKNDSYPKMFPNKHIDYNLESVDTEGVLKGLKAYSDLIEVPMYQDTTNKLKSSHGAFYPHEQVIFLNENNTLGEQITVSIHELAHATLHNPKIKENYNASATYNVGELEAEMTSYVVSNHYGIDTKDKAVKYMAGWTKNLSELDDNDLSNSMNRVQRASNKMIDTIDKEIVKSQKNEKTLNKNLSEQMNMPKKVMSR